MIREQRRAKRYNVFHGARIAQADGSFLGICRMIDLSRTGARLEMKMAGKLPDHFILVLSHDGRLRRQCLVVWRSETAVGVEFIPFHSAKRH